MSAVLVIDDDVNTLQAFERTLTAHGHLVRTAASGVAGLLQARDARLSLAFVDVRLPDVGGVAVLAQLRTMDPGLPVVMVMGFGYGPVVVQAMKRGARDFVIKPLHGADLLALVQNHARLAVTTGPTSHPHVLRALAVIGARYAESTLGPAEVAAAVGISLCHLDHLFEQAGLTVSGSLRQARIAAACQLLETSGQSVGRIAYLCGYVHRSPFYEAFKAERSCTPLAYRAARAEERRQSRHSVQTIAWDRNG